jgi:hypothetical protein
MNVAEKFFHGEFIRPTTLKRTSCSMPDSFVDFNQIWRFSTDFHKSPPYQISLKSVQWKPRTDGRTDGMTDGYVEANRRFLRL